MRLIVLILPAIGLMGANATLFTGTWREDTSKRKMNNQQTTLEITRRSDGYVNVTRNDNLALTETFALNGKPYHVINNDGRPDPNVEMAWVEVNESKWKSINSSRGQPFGTTTSEVSADGRTLTTTAEGTRAGTGQAFKVVRMFSRIAGSSGVFGKWKVKQLDLAPQVIRFEDTGQGSIRLRRGIDVSGSTAVSGESRSEGTEIMVSLKQLDDLTIEVTVTANGSIRTLSTFKLSFNGNQLVETVRPGGTEYVYTKQ